MSENKITAASNDRLVTGDDLFNLSEEDRKQMELQKESDSELQKSQKEFRLAEQVKSYFEVNHSLESNASQLETWKSKTRAASKYFSNSAQLTSHFIAAAIEGKESSFPNQQPTLQVLSVKKFPQTNAAKVTIDRYRLVVSDGLNVTHAMMNTQLNALCVERRIVKNTIIRVKKYIQNMVQNKRILILFEVEVLTPFDENIARIGNPNYNEDGVSSNTSAAILSASAHQNTDRSMPMSANNAMNNSNSAMQSNYQQKSAQKMQQSFAAQNNNNHYNNSSNTGYNTSSTPQKSNPSMNQGGNTQLITLIKQLSPYNQKWTILVQLQQKGDIRQWNKEKSQGKLFSVVFCDESGEIKATVFNEGVDSFYDLLVVGQAYYVSQAQIKTARKEYSTTDNDYEMTIDGKSQITPCLEKKFSPEVKYNRTMISELAQAEKDAYVDIIGVCKEASQLSEITTKQNKQLSKRELTLVDESGHQIRLTLWGQQAEQFVDSDFPVVAVRRAKVGDYGGKSLGCVSGTLVSVNPDNQLAFRVKGWYATAEKNGQEFKSFLNSATSGSRQDTFKTIEQVKDEQLGQGEKPDYFSVRGSIIHVKQDSLSYAACPAEGCSKKVSDDGNGKWRCEKCDRSYDAPEYRYILGISIADHSGQLWPQCFNEIGEIILGKSAGQMEMLKEANTPEYEATFSNVLFREGVFKIRAKMEHYNDEGRVRYGIIGYTPVDYVGESEYLVNEIESMMAC